MTRQLRSLINRRRWLTTARSWWSPQTPALIALLMAVHVAGGYDCPRCEWYVTIDGRPLPWRLVGRQTH